MRPIRDARRPMDAKEVALARGGDLALLVLVGEIHEHLHFDAARVAGADRRDRIAPDEESTVPGRPRLVRHVHPVELSDEVLILPFGAQEASRLARGNDLFVLYEKCSWSAVDVHPTREVFTVEHRLEANVLGVAGPQRRHHS